MKRCISSIKAGIFLLLPMLFTGMFCSGGGTISGTGPHKIGGVLYDSCNCKPAANATVYMRPADYLPFSDGLAKQTAAASSAVQTSVTDENGWFGFDDLIVGTFTIEGVSSDEKTAVLLSDIEISPDLLESRTWLHINSQGYETVLQSPSTIIGEVPVPQNCNGGTVSVFGTEHQTEINADGSFILEKIPESPLRLKIEYIANSVKYTDTISTRTITGQVTYIDTSNTDFNPRTVEPVTFNAMYNGFDFNRGVSIKQTAGGDYIIAGKDASALRMLKIDKYGTIVAENTFESYCQDECYFIEQVKGGFIIAGRSPDESSDYYNLTLMHIDSNGTTLWSKSEADVYIDEVTVIQEARDGGFIIAGNRSEPVSSAGFCLIKVNETGEVVWETVINGLIGVPGEIVQQTSDGGYVFTATSLYNQRFYIVKTNANGTELWEMSYGSQVVNSAHAIIQTSDGGYIITGSTVENSSSVANIHLIKTDARGEQLWEKTISNVNNQAGHEIKQTIDGGYIIVGTSTSGGNSNVHLLKTDNTGTQVWSKSYGDSNLIEDGHSVWLTSDGGFLFAAGGRSSGSNEAFLLLIKTDAYGDVD